MSSTTFQCLPLLLLLSSSFIVSRHDSISARLLHRDYKASEHLSRAERFRNAVHRSKIRAGQIVSRFSGSSASTLSYSKSEKEYNLEFGLGTPPVMYEGIMDTGSDVVWVQCAPCLSCNRTYGPIFSPSGSSTYRSVHSCGNNTALCASLNTTCEGSSSCSFDVAYLDGSGLSGSVANDVISMHNPDGESQELGRIVFGCAHDVWNQTDIASLVGFGQGRASFISQLFPKAERRFSYCMTRFDDATNKSSTMLFGAAAVLTAPNTQSTPILTNLSTIYFIGVDGISVNGRRIKPASGSVAQLMGNTTVIDSGTTFTILQSDVYSALVSTMEGLISLPKVKGIMFDLCFDMTGVTGYKFPSLAFHFANGASWKLPEDNYFAPVDDKHVCLAMMDSKELDTEMSLLGNFQQQNFQVLYDLHGATLSFAPAIC